MTKTIEVIVILKYLWKFRFPGFNTSNNEVSGTIQFRGRKRYV